MAGKKKPSESIEDLLDEAEAKELTFTILVSEKEFLRHLLHIQKDGGWGNNLDDVINNRINALK